MCFAHMGKPLRITLHGHLLRLSSERHIYSGISPFRLESGMCPPPGMNRKPQDPTAMHHPATNSMHNRLVLHQSSCGHIYHTALPEYEIGVQYFVTVVHIRSSHIFSFFKDAWLSQHVSRHDGLWSTLWPTNEQHAWNDEHSRWITLSHGAQHGQ